MAEGERTLKVVWRRDRFETRKGYRIDRVAGEALQGRQCA
jgi:hypothetical protein